MQNHCKNYNGSPLNDKTSCENCGLPLDENEEVSHHKTVCNGSSKSLHKTPVACKSSNSTLADDRFKKWENQILTFGQAFCDNQECNFVGMTVSDLEDHVKSCNGVPNFSLFCCIHCRCGFSTKEDHLKHQQNCNITIRFDNSVQKRGDSLHFRVIKRMKSSESGDDHIIQPMPDFPKGQYRRRRPYSIQHIKSWVLSLEKFKYVKCIYQNCYFIAMSLEDMISHFGYCNGDGDFAKFVCQYCNGRVTSEAVLQKHITRSHPLENSHVVESNSAESNYIKVEPQSEENNDGILFADMELQSTEEADTGSQENVEGAEEINEVTKMRQSACWRVWKCEINEFGHAFCRKSLCNFMAPNIPLLEVHLRTCDGTPDFEFLNCPKCRYRLPTRDDLVRHMSKCTDDRMRYHPTRGSQVVGSRSVGLDGKDDFEVGPVFRQDEGKSFKFYSKNRKVNPFSTSERVQPYENDSDNIASEDNVDRTSKNSKGLNSKESSSKKKRGRPKSAPEEKSDKVNGNNQLVKCGKCGNFQGTKKDYDEHNLRTHVGLGWIEGETPVDMNDEKLLVRLVKEAFKLSKKAMCEKCDDVKRSVLGFVSHIQNCGKTEEEKEALKAQCPYCGGKYLKYSINSHIKLCRSSPQDGEKNENVEEILEPSGKRRSAIKAVSKFQQVLSDNDEANSIRESNYILYEKGSERIPKLNPKLNYLWYRLKRENKKIPCRHTNCKNVSSDVKEAKSHHYNCPLLPERVFLCESCDFYSVDEPSVQSHVTTHRKCAKSRNGEEVKVEVESNENDDDDDDGDDDNEVDEDELDVRSSGGEFEDYAPASKKLKRKKSLYDEEKAKRAKFSTWAVKLDLDVESRLKQNFCRREKIDSLRGTQFYSNGLTMTLEEELSKTESSELWPELHTSRSDWVQVPLQQAMSSLPQLTESVSVRFTNNDSKWRRFEWFESDIVEGVPVMFTGGSVRSLSWCKVSFERMLQKTQKQYLAVSTARKADHFRDIHDRSSFQKSTLLQIWECGVLDNALSQQAPKFTLGIVHDGGEVWDVAWFPEDTHSEATENRLKRLGLLATAAEDGFVRIWSICDPEQLESTKGLPVYKTEAKVVLMADKDFDEGCFQLAVGPDGVLAGGFGNGAVAVWNLKNLSSPFCKNSGVSKTIRAHLIIQAHKTAITALTFCPVSSRYVSTAGLDRFVKVWDTEHPLIPIEQYNKEYSLDNIWTKNWPSLIYNFDDVVLNFNKGAMKFIKDIVTERHQSTFAMEDTCLSLSFSDWLNALCGGSITGEVKLRLLKNLVHDQKKSQSTISSVRLEKLNGCGKKESEGPHGGKAKETDATKTLPKTYDEVNTEFGLVFRDNLGMDKGKPKKPETHPETFPIRAVNKVRTQVAQLFLSSPLHVAVQGQLRGHILTGNPSSVSYEKYERRTVTHKLKKREKSCIRKIAFNPNFISFTHIAVGYNCGLIRIQPLKELQSARSVKFFLEKAQKRNV